MKTFGITNTGQLLKGVSYGLTEVKMDKRREIVTITHTGNMGHSIDRNVNPNLRKLGIPSVEFLKMRYDVIEDKGWPDYMYTLKLKIN